MSYGVRALDTDHVRQVSSDLVAEHRQRVANFADLLRQSTEADAIYVSLLHRSVGAVALNRPATASGSIRGARDRADLLESQAETARDKVAATLWNSREHTQANLDLYIDAASEDAEDAGYAIDPLAD